MTIKLKKQEMCGLLLDNPITINGITFDYLDDVKIYMLENNIDIEVIDDIYENGVEDDDYNDNDNKGMTYNDYWHIRVWFFAKDILLPDEEAERLSKEWREETERLDKLDDERRKKLLEEKRKKQKEELLK
jgi:hypothetical protein